MPLLHPGGDVPTSRSPSWWLQWRSHWLDMLLDMPENAGKACNLQPAVESHSLVPLSCPKTFITFVPYVKAPSGSG